MEEVGEDFDETMKKGSDDDNNLASMASGVGAKQMMAGFSILRLVSLAGGMMNLEITKEQLLEMNAKLNKIKKKD